MAPGKRTSVTGLLDPDGRRPQQSRIVEAALEDPDIRESGLERTSAGAPRKRSWRPAMSNVHP